MKTPPPEAFRSGRQFAAWTRAGDEALRSVLVVGATALIRRVREGRSRAGQRFETWVEALLRRKPAKLVAVALANKLARIA